jgi:hypothetical protein
MAGRCAGGNIGHLKRRLTIITKFRAPTRLAGIWAVILIVVLSGAMLTEARSEAGKAGKSSDELAVEATLTDMLDAMNRNDFDRWEEFYVREVFNPAAWKRSGCIRARLLRTSFRRSKMTRAHLGLTWSEASGLNSAVKHACGAFGRKPVIEAARPRPSTPPRCKPS